MRESITTVEHVMPKPDIGALTAFMLIASAPLIGLAFYLLFPFIAAALFVGVVCYLLAEQFGWVKRTI